MAFLGTQAEQDCSRVEREVNRKEKGEDAHNPERNRLREHVACAKNGEQCHELHHDRQNERLAHLLWHDFVAPVHGVHTERGSESKRYIQRNGGQKDNRSNNSSCKEHSTNIKKGFLQAKEVT